MRLDTFMISVLLGLMFISGGILVIGGFTTTYDVTTTDPVFAGVEEDINDIYANSDLMKEKITGQEVGSETAENNLFTGAFKAIPLFWQMFIAVPKLINSLALSMGIPPVLISTFIVIIMVAAVWSMIYTFMRFQPK